MGCHHQPVAGSCEAGEVSLAFDAKCKIIATVCSMTMAQCSFQTQSDSAQVVMLLRQHGVVRCSSIQSSFAQLLNMLNSVMWAFGQAVQAAERAEGCRSVVRQGTGSHGIGDEACDRPFKATGHSWS